MRLLILALLAATALNNAHAYDLPIGALGLTLGQGKEEVMKQLHKHYFIVKVSGNDDLFFVSEGKPPKVKTIGGVTFENGRLVSIQRNWGHFDGKVHVAEISRVLYAAMESARTASGSDAATVTTRTQNTPDLEFKSIYYLFGARKVTVTSTTGKDTQQISVDESVSARPK